MAFTIIKLKSRVFNDRKHIINDLVIHMHPIIITERKLTIERYKVYTVKYCIQSPQLTARILHDINLFNRLIIFSHSAGEKR